MKNLKYLAYAVPCCMALSGAGDGVFLCYDNNGDFGFYVGLSEVKK